MLLRPAEIKDVDCLDQLIKLSSRVLGKGFYTAEEIEFLNEYVFGIDMQLIEDQTYFVVEYEGQEIACGGWSYRSKLFGGHQVLDADSQTNEKVAKIRSVFVHPDFAKKGIATQVLRYCERQAFDAGFEKVELMSTLPGVPFYHRHGYVGEENILYRLPNGVQIVFKPMSKKLGKVDV